MTKNNVKLLNNFKHVLSEQLLGPPCREHPQASYIIMSRYDCRYTLCLKKKHPRCF